MEKTRDRMDLRGPYCEVNKYHHIAVLSDGETKHIYCSRCQRSMTGVGWNERRWDDPNVGDDYGDDWRDHEEE